MKLKFIKDNEEHKLIKDSLAYVKPYRKKLIFTIIITSASILFGLLQPLILGRLIDLINSKEYSRIISTIIIAFSLLILEGIFTLVENYYINYIANKIVLDLRSDLYNNILHIPINIFDSMKSGEFISRFESDIATLSDILSARLVEFIVNILKIVIIGFFIFRINAKMSIYLIILFPVSYIISRFFAKRIKAKTLAARKLSDSYLSFFQESLLGIKEIKQLLIEKQMNAKMRSIQQEYFKKNIDKNLNREYAKLANVFISAIVVCGLMFIGANNIMNGLMTLGSYVAFTNYSSKFYMSLNSMIRFYSVGQETLVSIKRIFELIGFIKTNEKDESLDSNSFNFTGKIDLRDIKFGYDENSPVLDDINLSFEPHKWNGVVGYSGIGKTTIFKLILSFYKPQSGSILFDDKSISEISETTIRENIAYVSQESFFFNTSIKENLLYANKNLTYDRMVDICKQVGIDEYIETLPNKYETTMQEMGSNFSVGQKQRLNIARAVAKNPKVFLFDEPTSSLDGEMKKNIIDLIKDLTKEHTVIVVSHDDELIQNCDNIFIIDNGRIVDQGSHSELIEKNKLFYKLFSNEVKQSIAI